MAGSEAADGKFKAAGSHRAIQEITGLFSLITSEGNVLFLFSNALKRDEFLRMARMGNANPGGKIGHVELEADSFSDAARHILAMDLDGG